MECAHLAYFERVRIMDATSLVQLMVKTVQSKQNHSLTQVISFWSQQRFPAQTGRKACTTDINLSLLIASPAGESTVLSQGKIINF